MKQNIHTLRGRLWLLLLAMPFDMNSAQIASSPLAGATIKELNESSSSLDGGNLTLTFKNADFIEVTA